MSAETFDMKLYKKALKLAKKGKAIKSEPQSCVAYEGEKQIEIDARQILALQKQNGELTDKIKELTEAKEIIRELISWQILTQYWEAKAKAEAFLKE